jgi:hypothetical protein
MKNAAAAEGTLHKLAKGHNFFEMSQGSQTNVLDRSNVTLETST